MAEDYTSPTLCSPCGLKRMRDFLAHNRRTSKQIVLNLLVGSNIHAIIHYSSFASSKKEIYGDK